MTGCDKETDELVDRGVELKALYTDAFCAAASDASCAVSEDTCAFQPYVSVDACETAVNITFSDCANLWEPMAEAEDGVLACIEALGAFTCDADGLCDEGGYSVFPLPECQVVDDLQALWCEGADTY